MRPLDILVPITKIEQLNPLHTKDLTVATNGIAESWAKRAAAAVQS
jgi:hypothetical protein